MWWAPLTSELIITVTCAWSASRDLLVVALALQAEHIDVAQFTSLVRLWSSDKSRRIEELIAEHEYLETNGIEEVRRLVERKVKRFDGDVRMALASVMDDRLDVALQELSGSEIAGLVSELRDPAQVTYMATLPISGERTERYSLTGIHAEGGLGRVWLARDNELQRRVALKELHPERAGEPEAVRRFLREAQITGQLDHPNIIPVYDLGRHEEDGQPYYTMRFVQGRTLAGSIEKFHEQSEKHKSRKMALVELLNALVSVCHAVSYAHSKGVTHRDIKPANILVGPFGDVVLLDWGLAKAVEVLDSDKSAIGLASVAGGWETVAGGPMGTPAYMAPEQAAGILSQINEKTDIYGLGTVLFHILTGRPPHQAAALESSKDFCERIAGCRSPTTRSLRSSVPRTLDAICAKAMSRYPADRYDSATDLAQEIQRYLADEPVVAYVESWPERFVRWLRRHRRWALASATAVCLVAVVSGVAAVWINQARQQESRQRRRAEAAQIVADASRAEAVQHFQTARAAVDTWLTGTSEALRYHPAAQSVREQLLKEAAKDYRAFVSASPEIAVETGRAHLRLGDVERLLGNHDEAEQAYRNGTMVLKRIEADGGPDRLSLVADIASSRIKLAMLYAETGQPSRAAELLDNTLQQLRPIQDVQPTPINEVVLLAQVLMNQGELLSRRGEFAKARNPLVEAVELLEHLIQQDLLSTQQFETLAKAHTVLTKVYEQLGDHSQAEKQIRRAIARLDVLDSLKSNHPPVLEGIAAAHIYHASLLRVMGQIDEEEAAYQQALEDYRALIRAMPDVPFFGEQLALTLTDLGQMLHELGENPQAQPILLEAKSGYVELASNHPRVPRYHEGLAAAQSFYGQVTHDLNQTVQAAEELRQAVRKFQALVETFPDVDQYRERLELALAHWGQVRHALGEETAAVPLDESIELLTALSQESPEVPAYRDELARVYAERGWMHHDRQKTDLAQDDFAHARDIWLAISDEDPSVNVLDHAARFLAECPLPELRQPAKAMSLARRALQLAPRNADYILVTRRRRL